MSDWLFKESKVYDRVDYCFGCEELLKFVDGNLDCG